MPDTKSETEESDDGEDKENPSDNPSDRIFVSFTGILKVFECKKSDTEDKENPEDWEMKISHIEVPHIFSEIGEKQGCQKDTECHEEDEESNLDIFSRYKITCRSRFHLFFLDLIEDFFFHSHKSKKLKNKVFFHIFFRPVYERADGPDGDSEDIADLVITLVFHESEDEHLPVFFPYLGQGSLYHPSRLFSVEVHIGTEVAFDIVDQETVWFIIEAHLLYFAVFTKVIDDVIVGDAVYPGWEGEILWDFEDIFVDFYEYLLQ
ncbi:MAG: hypothetical protein ACD_71C00171G0001 [uncultured bacterium (gcode 4)]|uniref:Uncharacterized protein n=1 Tax=uncultured bacterium (gcode 4) TaxID=1234023 RepID=K1Z4Y5_9BACT|nr:MAG: hypothetical protein ACD_71C00171G0001 [uncultured bacterium (gcode 4)]